MVPVRPTRRAHEAHEQRATVIALSGVVAVTAAACGGGGSTATSSGSGTSAAAAAKGGTLYYLTKRAGRAPRPAAHVHRARHLQRGPHGLPHADDLPGGLRQGRAPSWCPTSPRTRAHASDGGKTWKFTLKDGIKWQDGKAITCDDFKYGISRTFATDVITGGPNYAIQFLDIAQGHQDGCLRPTRARTPRRQGSGRLRQGRRLRGQHHHLPPEQAGRRLQLRASTCRPSRPTARTRTRATSPTTRSSPTARTSCRAPGPRTRAARSSATPTGTRRPDTLRKAYPDKIVFTEGLTDEVIAQRLIS